MSQNGKLMPNLDQQSTKLLNLTVLQRIDPFVEEILITAAHVTFYEFNIDLSQWVRPFSSLIFPFYHFLSLSHNSLMAFAEPQGRWRIPLRCQEVRCCFLNIYHITRFMSSTIQVFELEICFQLRLTMAFVVLLFQEHSTAISVYCDEPSQYWLVSLSAFVNCDHLKYKMENFCWFS